MNFREKDLSKIRTLFMYSEPRFRNYRIKLYDSIDFKDAESVRSGLSHVQTRKSQAARKGKWPPRGTGNRQAPPILEVRPCNKQGW